MSLNVVFLASAKSREYAIAEPFTQGVHAYGDTCRIVHTADYEGPQSETDVAVCVGIKGWSHLIMETHLAAGKHFIICDKGYVGGPTSPRSKYIRVSIDELQPLSYFQRNARPDDRIRALGVEIKPYRMTGQNILIAGGSLKYAQWHRMDAHDNMDPATMWARKTYNILRKHTQKPLVYRPKPSWKEAKPVEGTRFSRPPITIEEELRNTFCLVTYGSNAAVDATIAGVPVIVTGDGIAKPMSTDDLCSVDRPHYPTDVQRWQWLSDVSYAQFDLQEFASGLAWSILRPQVIMNAKMRGYDRT